jgi:hypothetical protein
MNPVQTEVRDNDTNLVYDPIGACPFPVRGVNYRNEDYPENPEPDPLQEEETDEAEELEKLQSMDLGEVSSSRPTRKLSPGPSPNPTRPSTNPASPATGPCPN